MRIHKYLICKCDRIFIQNEGGHEKEEEEEEEEGGGGGRGGKGRGGA